MNQYQQPTTDNNNPYSPPTTYGDSQLVATNNHITDNDINFNHASYALYLFSYFTAGLTWVIPIFMNYVKRDTARGTWLYSHYDWQIKTFWYSIFFWILGMAMIFFGFGGLLFGALVDSGATMGGSLLLGMAGLFLTGITLLWHLYRIVRGWIALTNRRPVL